MSVPTDSPPTPPEPEAAVSLAGTHFKVGWAALVVFLLLSIALETLHGFKSRWYLDVSNETRRLMWTLAHTHGTLLSILNIVFGLSIPKIVGWQGSTQVLASRCMLASLFLLPVGFLLGGLFINGGDPGIGVLLVPPGALLLLIAVLLTARAARRCRLD